MGLYQFYSSFSGLNNELDRKSGILFRFRYHIAFHRNHCDNLDLDFSTDTRKFHVVSFDTI